MVGGEGAVIFLEKLSPAIEQVDSSSGAIGTAVNNAIIIAQVGFYREREFRNVLKAAQVTGIYTGFIESIPVEWDIPAGASQYIRKTFEL